MLVLRTGYFKGEDSVSMSFFFSVEVLRIDTVNSDLGIWSSKKH